VLVSGVLVVDVCVCVVDGVVDVFVVVVLEEPPITDVEVEVVDVLEDEVVDVVPLVVAVPLPAPRVPPLSVEPLEVVEVEVEVEPLLSPVLPPEPPL
jgi:hypothetical protein